jgi:hypothetical protein
MWKNWVLSAGGGRYNSELPRGELLSKIGTVISRIALLTPRRANVVWVKETRIKGCAGPSDEPYTEIEREVAVSRYRPCPCG